MKKFYIRWSVFVGIGLFIAALGVARYLREVTTIPPEGLVEEGSSIGVRVQGMVKAGTIAKGASEITFQLAGERESIPVRYSGPEPDNLREMKTLVVVGRWNPSARILSAEKISLIPNYGFVAAAYLISLLPAGVFLFWMERKVAFLFDLIRNEKIYEWEGSS